MKSVAAAPSDAAERLWARVAGDTILPEDLIAPAERICAQLRTGLGRWIGADGYRALLDRAISQTRAAHPVLDSLVSTGGNAPATRTAARAHGAAEVAAGMVALVSAVTELLGRIIGEEMAVRLVEQVGAPSPPEVVNIKRKAGHDG